MELDPWVLDIEVYGVVYLFNPVDIDRLGVEKVTEDTELAVTVEPTVEENPLPTPDGALPEATGDGTGVDVPADATQPEVSVVPEGTEPTGNNPAAPSEPPARPVGPGQ